MSDEQNSPAPEEAPPATAEADEPTVDAPAEAEPAADEAAAAAAEEAPAAEAEPEPQVNPDAEIVFVLGGPGSGKGTQCEQIVEKYGFKHYSAGDLLRAEVASGSEMGKELEEIMKEGKLVPSSVTIKLLKKAIATSDGMKFLIDGFPRALDQAEEFEKEVIPCKLVLFFDCPQDVMQERLLKRAETSGRADDNIETIKKRFDTFVNASMPVIEHFEKVDKVAKISAVPTPDEVFVEVCKVMDTQFASLAELEAAAIKLQSAGRGLLARKAARAKADGDGAADEAPAAEEAPAADDEAPAAEAEPEPQVNPDAEIVFVLGGPGSGKGTQCEQIVEKYGFKHYSAGDLLRAEVASGSEMGKELEEIMKEGKLVPSSVTIKLLKKAIATSDGMKFLIDGFPRALDQAEEFEKEVIPCKLVLFFDCPQDVMQERLLKRAETSGRADDNIETIKKRFDTFVNASMPVIEHFEKVDKVAKISAVPTPDEVFVEVCKVMDTQFASLAELEAAAIKLQSAGRGLLARKAARAKADGDGAADEAPAAEEAPAADDEAPAAEAEPEPQVNPDAEIVFVLGGPGSGKGTQCEQIVEKYGFKHYSAGDLLRAEVASGSEMGKELEEIMKEGKLVPSSVTIKLLKKAIATSDGMKFLIDGFPRALDQAEEFEKEVIPCKLVLFFDCPQDVMQERLLKRAETSGRADDNIETIKKRFDTFVNASMPVIEHFEKVDKVAKISAVPTPDEVFVEVCKVMDTQFASLAELEAAAIKLQSAGRGLLARKAARAKADGDGAAEEAPAAEAEPEPQVNPDAEIVFVLGGPGSGKGTQCEQIVEKYGFKHYSAGDLLRAEVASGSEMGKELEEIMKEGKLVPSSVTIKLLKKAIATSDGMKFLIDGFPRALDQAEEFEKEVIPCKLVLFFDCPQDVMQERLLKRAETSGRADDNIETIKKRFDTFVNASMPVIEHFEKVDKVAKISAVPTPDEVFVEVCKVMDTQFASLAELEAAAIKLQSAGRGLLARKAARAKADGDGAAEEAPAEEAPKHEVQVLKIEGGAETIADYLAKHEIPAHLKVCLKKLDVTKGDAPYRFLASYFSMVADERGEPAL